jgi:glycosyltransferase involved in cell wall biosynthesis
MKAKSSYNSYYRYQIETAMDLTPETFSRRKSKAGHNHKKDFFFEVASNPEVSGAEIEFFLSAYVKDSDLVFLPVEKSAFVENLPGKPDIFFIVSRESDLPLVSKLSESARRPGFLFTPLTSKEMKKFVQFFEGQKEKIEIFWRFLPYNPAVPNSLTLSQINSYDLKFPTLEGLEIFNSNVPKHYELQPEPQMPYSIKWELRVKNAAPKISVVIPTYNNALFLSNVVWHLSEQDFPKEDYEIIIADDGSQDNTCEIIQELFSRTGDKFNITYIYWPKWHPQRGDQQFFRSGLARNLGSRYSSGEYLLFLDSDMLVPKNFVETALNSLKKNGIIQFQRYHINQELSRSNPSYEKVNIATDTYVEEKHYWSVLFNCTDWNQMPQHWKYTCTYALGIKKSDFLEIGMFKKYYISYGFEDTDLGYEAHKKNLKFELVKLPLLHLTAYDQMQYKNSFSKRVKLLRVTAELFYLQHMDKEIYHLLGDYYKMQKPLKSFVRDLFKG